MLPERLCRVVLACAVLHNIAMQYNLPEPDNEDEEEEEEGADQVDHHNDGRAGVRVREALIQNHFD